jgi:hypothetical protein
MWLDNTVLNLFTVIPLVEQSRSWSYNGPSYAVRAKQYGGTEYAVAISELWTGTFKYCHHYHFSVTHSLIMKVNEMHYFSNL